MHARTASTAEYFVTVSSGLELVGAEEIRQRLWPAHVEQRRGKVRFGVTEAQAVSDLLRLRAVDRLYAFVAEVPDIPQDGSGLQRLEGIPAEVDWSSAIRLWRRFFPAAPQRPRFRVTARRGGEQAYRSPEIAAAVGAGLVDRFGWPVDLEDYEVEVFVHLTGDRVMIGLALGRQGLHRRPRPAVGRTALKQSVAHAMARLAGPVAGEVIVDPMCGVGTIPIEAAMLCPAACVLGSDISATELAKAQSNVEAVEAPVRLLRADARQLPLAEGAAAAIVSDMPFGRRVGSHRSNRKLYPPALAEMGRVVRPGGRAVLLTLEKRLMERCLSTARGWHVEQNLRVNVGGLEPRLLVLRRTDASE